MGFSICMFISLVIYPVWAVDELHYSTASKFDKLANSIQGFLEAYLKKMESGKENKAGTDDVVCIQACKSVLNSKSNDESLVNYARWEPWHGKFGLYYPWDKYEQVGEHLTELAAAFVSLKSRLQSSKQFNIPIERQTMKETCEIFMLHVQWVLRKLGESIKKMEKCGARVNLILPKLQSMKLEYLTPLNTCCSKMQKSEENLAVASFSFLLMEIVKKIEILANKVEELGESADFLTRKYDV